MLSSDYDSASLLLEVLLSFFISNVDDNNLTRNSSKPNELSYNGKVTTLTRLSYFFEEMTPSKILVRK